MDKNQREQLILSALLERRLAVEEEARHLKARAIEMTRADAELRDEIAALDAILGARVQPPPTAPSVPTALTVAATPAEVAPSAPSEGTTKKKRRRKGSRREEMLPAMRAKFGTGTFDTEGVTDLILAAEGGERRKVYFAAWSLIRDLAEDGVIEVASEEGSGPRKKRTYRFAEAGRP